MVATEHLPDGPRTDETFPPDEINALAEHPRLTLLQPIYGRYHAEPVDFANQRVPSAPDGRSQRRDALCVGDAVSREA